MAPGPSRARAAPFRPPKKRPYGKIAVGVLVLVVAGAIVAKRLQPKPVTTTPVVRGTAVEAVYATGTVEAMDRVVVKAKIGGTIGDLKAREGVRVKKGDLLARVDSPSLKHDLARGKADLWAAATQASKKSPQLEALDAQIRSTEAQLKIARDERDRSTKLQSTGTVAPAELDRATTQVATLEAQLAAQQAQRRSAEVDLAARASGASAAVDSLAARLADAEVRAPIDGVVLAKLVDPGENVVPNQVLFRIGDTSNLVLECPIDEADIGRVTLGAKTAVSLYAFAGRAFHGSVVEIMPDADRVKKSFLTRVRLTDAPEGMRSGMSAEVNVILEERPSALLAPAEALDASGAAWIVRDGRVERRTLKLGTRDMLRVEILDGVTEGDQLVVAGGDTLSPGARVAATVKAPDVAAAQPSRPKAGL